tara:strand:+ start:26 stop:703 length:678 start_codon:yes stop_codon:yes gene_type:complete
MYLEKNLNQVEDHLLTDDELRIMELQNLWNESKGYVINQAAKKLENDLNKIRPLVDAKSNCLWITRFISKLNERKLDWNSHPEFVTKVLKDKQGVYLGREGKFLKDFDIDNASDSIHIFGEVRLSSYNDRTLDFAIISKRNNNILKFIVECQTWQGHLAPKDKHRDCQLGRSINLEGEYKFLEYSSWEIFGDSNISSIDKLVEFIELGKGISSNLGRKFTEELDF